MEWKSGALRAVLLLAAGALLSFVSGRAASGGGKRGVPVVLGLPALIVADLFSAGIGYNPTAAQNEVYPKTPLISALQAKAGHDRIAPVNRSFSFGGPSSVLPPNGAMVFGLHDVQGYDSLFPGQYKRFMDEAAAPVDPRFLSSPLQVGNMVFAKNPASPHLALAGVRYIVSRQTLDLPDGSFVDGIYVYPVPGAPGRARVDAGTARWVRDEPTRIELETDSSVASTLTLADQFYPGWYAQIDGKPAVLRRADQVFRRLDVPAGTHRVTFQYSPSSFRIGLFLALAALAGCFGCLAASRGSSRSSRGSGMDASGG